MKKMLIVSLMLAMVLISAPAFAGGFVSVSSGARVASGNFGPGASFEKAWNGSSAGFSANQTITSWTVNIGPFHISHSTNDVGASTFANTQGGTFGNGIGFQSGSAFASFSK